MYSHVRHQTLLAVAAANVCTYILCQSDWICVFVCVCLLCVDASARRERERNDEIPKWQHACENINWVLCMKQATTSKCHTCVCRHTRTAYSLSPAVSMHSVQWFMCIRAICGDTIWIPNGCILLFLFLLFFLFPFLHFGMRSVLNPIHIRIRSNQISPLNMFEWWWCDVQCANNYR